MERQTAALALRRGGRDFRSIAAELGYAGPAGAYRAVCSALRDMPRGEADLLRMETLERLDAVLRAVWPAAECGHLKAVETVLKIEAQRATLLGLAAPSRTELVGDLSIDPGTLALMRRLSGLSDDEVVEELAAMHRSEARRANGGILPAALASTNGTEPGQ